jgi:hypothetical protein
LKLNIAIVAEREGNDGVQRFTPASLEGVAQVCFDNNKTRQKKSTPGFDVVGKREDQK